MSRVPDVKYSGNEIGIVFFGDNVLGIELYTINGGKLQLSFSTKYLRGDGVQRIDVSAIPSGCYIVKITDGPVQYEKRITVVR